jgi:energy-coupling factor transporter ATP-binding protein EcfA2
MNDNTVPSIFESINARFLSPEQVAKTFVKPPYFDKLLKPCHSIIVGPRGSGKTTLLKMLQGPSLSAWSDPEAKSYRTKINYSTVFVPTDILWTKQIQEIGQPELSNKEAELISKAVFTTHTLHKYVQTLQYRISYTEKNIKNTHRPIICTDKQEAKLVKLLSACWQLEIDTFSLLSLKRSLTDRISKIFEIASLEKFLPSEDRSERIARYKFLHIDFLQSIVQGIEIGDDVFKGSSEKWAFMFDELELAPKYIVNCLYESLRSAHSALFFKLSFSPYNEDIKSLESALSAMPGHDFEFIQLWYPNKEDSFRFSTSLINSMIKQRGITEKNLDSILSEPSFKKHGREKKSLRYSPDNYNYDVLKSLYNKDKSFRDYIIKNKIDFNLIDKLNENERAQKIRKLFPIVEVREFFRQPDYNYRSGSGKKRSRKTYPLFYTGAQAIIDILEGNPRLIIGVVGPFLDKFKNENRKISSNEQIEQIRKAINQFRSLLSALPCKFEKCSSQPKSIISIIDIIGEWFNRDIIVERFKGEPQGSFIVDRSISKEIESSLSVALNAGAIIYVPGATSKLIIQDLYDRRFRITYLLAPHYKLPIQLMREIPLNRIFSKKHEKQLSFGWE